MEKIQDLFRSCSAGNFVLEPGEYKGPLYIDRPCIVDGCNSTLWADTSPVLVVLVPNVTIRNLRVEVTGNHRSESERIAIKTSDLNTIFENIEVSGNVVGSAHESELWDLPGMVSLGDFAAEKENTFSISFHAPCGATLDSMVKGLSLSPTQLSAGENSILLSTRELKDNTILYGEIVVKTSVSRRIYVTGRACYNSPRHSVVLPASRGPDVSLPVQIEPPEEVIAPVVPDTDIITVRKGQRLFVREIGLPRLKIVFEYREVLKPVEIDTYCFLLQKNGKVSCDEDLIFFGNAESAGKAVRISQNGKTATTYVDFDQIDDYVDRITICYSIYGSNAVDNFSLVAIPVVRVFSDGREALRFELKNLYFEKTVIAMEFYRYKGEWKLNFVGSGYHSDLKKLCEEYGVDVM